MSQTGHIIGPGPSGQSWLPRANNCLFIVGFLWAFCGYIYFLGLLHTWYFSRQSLIVATALWSWITIIRCSVSSGTIMHPNKVGARNYVYNPRASWFLCRYIAKTLYGDEEEEAVPQNNTTIEEPKLLGLHPVSKEKVWLVVDFILHDLINHTNVV